MEYNDPIITSRTVFARNCEVRKIDRKTADSFLDANHVYGKASCRDCYGLFLSGKDSMAMSCDSRMAVESSSGELVAVATFSNARRWEKQGRTVSSYEWVRYASLDDTRVIGGMGKLLDAFITDRHPDDIMTYAISTAIPGRPLRSGFDSEGNVFRKLGFIEESRRTFPSRIKGEEGRLSTSIKFRLKLTDWE